ncbi:MAG TPA: uracil-DNA glycosylase [Candidatus Angelobacter sp.]|jgi:DNA polymerase|nr:uracil-DNA glycosylase [Candidatus Angelobacter sp.]
MSKLDPEKMQQLAAHVNYYREMGIYDFYRQPVPEGAQNQVMESLAPDPPMITSMPKEKLPTRPAESSDKIAALRVIREDIGDCRRCRLHERRTNIVFGVGNVNPDIMFVGEGPGADEDAQGEPFVGRAGQLLNNMIAAMGIKREEVYIANVVKCRPPGNRTPENDECGTCSPFLLRQIEVIKPKVIVALGATAAKTLLAVNDSMGNLRGRWYDFRGSRLAVTYHPSYLLRDPRQKKEAWKDLQMVMKYLGLTPSAKAD